MIAKMIEIRDAMTFIPAMAVKMTAGHSADTYLLRRAGYGEEECVLLVWLERGKAEYDPHHWNSRTLTVAHQWVIKNFDIMEPAQVVDVQFILGEAADEKQSERHGYPLA